jgi:hypothetical protein
MVPLGIHPYGFYALDYESLFPWFERDSLWVYLVHQPVIWGGLWIIKFVQGW